MRFWIGIVFVVLLAGCGSDLESVEHGEQVFVAMTLEPAKFDPENFFDFRTSDVFLSGGRLVLSDKMLRAAGRTQATANPLACFVAIMDAARANDSDSFDALARCPITPEGGEFYDKEYVDCGGPYQSGFQNVVGWQERAGKELAFSHQWCSGRNFAFLGPIEAGILPAENLVRETIPGEFYYIGSRLPELDCTYLFFKSIHDYMRRDGAPFALDTRPGEDFREMVILSREDVAPNGMPYSMFARFSLPDPDSELFRFHQDTLSALAEAEATGGFSSEAHLRFVAAVGEDFLKALSFGPDVIDTKTYPYETFGYHMRRHIPPTPRLLIHLADEMECLLLSQVDFNPDHLRSVWILGPPNQLRFAHLATQSAWENFIGEPHVQTALLKMIASLKDAENRAGT